MSDLDTMAILLGVTRNKTICVPCSACGIACNPVSPLDCFCVRCVAEQRRDEEKRTTQARNK